MTGHKSTKALEVYEQPTVQQEQAVKGAYCRGTICTRDKVITHSWRPTEGHASSLQHRGGNLLGSMFSGLNGCTMNISPKNVVVNPLLTIVKLFILQPNNRNRELFHGFQVPRSNAMFVLIKF